MPHMYEKERSGTTKFGQMLREKDEDVGDITLGEVQHAGIFKDRMEPWLESKAVIELFAKDPESEEAWTRWQAVRPTYQQFMADMRALRVEGYPWPKKP